LCARHEKLLKPSAKEEQLIKNLTDKSNPKTMKKIRDEEN